MRSMLLGMVLAWLNACAESGEKAKSEGLIPDSTAQIFSGQIRQISGASSGFTDWTIVLVAEDSAQAFVSSIDKNGRYNFLNAPAKSFYHMFILDEKHQITSSLGDDISRVYVARFSHSELPPLVYRGRTFQFLEFNHVEQKVSESLDKNANGVLDVFDDDANSSGTMDAFESDEALKRETKSPLHWHAYQLYLKGNDHKEMRFQLAQSDSLKEVFVETLAKGVFANALSLKGSSLTDATEKKSWNNLLEDDGQSMDERSNDGIWGQRVELASKIFPSPEQVFFYRVLHAGHYKYYPFRVPNVVIEPLSFAVTGRNVRLENLPFGAAVQEFPWSVHIYQTSQHIAFSAEIASGKVFEIPAGALESGKDYEIRVLARSYAKKAGLPLLLIESDSKPYLHP